MLKCECCKQGDALCGTHPAALWEAPQKVRLSCIYLTSCLLQQEQGGGFAPVWVLTPSAIYACFRIYSLNMGQVFALTMIRWANAQWQLDQRGGEVKCAVESGTGCPKSLLMRDPKCFTMMYSEQLIKMFKYVPVNGLFYFSVCTFHPSYGFSLCFWRVFIKCSNPSGYYLKSGAGQKQVCFLGPSNFISPSIIEAPHSDWAGFCLLF